MTELIADIKFRHRLASISLLTHLLREAINAAYSNDTLPTLVIPIPLSRRRLLTRGHDQAALLARGIGAQLGIAVDVMALQRQRHTRPQSELTDRRTRRQNVRGAFRCSLTGAPAHVALIDDVMTTGTTIDEATRVLRRQGVTRVDIWVAARTPLRRGSRWVD